MLRNIRFLFFLSAVVLVQLLHAQPAARRAEIARKKSTPLLSVRSATQYAGKVEHSSDLVWERAIYRSLDLKKEANAPLYYPVEPIGKRVNFFTSIIRLLLANKVPAYDYRLDGNELFTSDNKMDVQGFLDRFHIYYEKKSKNKKDSSIVVNNSDIPSAEVLSYFIKEVYYFDQRTSTYSSRVVAICPVLHRTDMFSTTPVKSPLFWIKFDDLSHYLNYYPIMVSNYNNTSNLTISDYFTAHLYKGDIYKTTNMLNQTLSQYCPTDSALVKEQQRIESELTTFESHLWEVAPEKEVEPVLAPSDSTLVAEKSVSTKKSVRNSKRKGRDKMKSKSSKSSVKDTKKAKSKTSSSSGVRISVRRSRR